MTPAVRAATHTVAVTESTSIRWDHAIGGTIPFEAAPRPPTALARSDYYFPDAHLAEGDGPAAVGADFSPSTIIEAYRAGYFPWPHDAEEYLWFSPDPRAVLPVGGLHVSGRLARTIRQRRFRLTFDTAFGHVLAACADRVEGSWITPAYTDGYVALHRLGWAHSIEVWQDDLLAGGLYGIRTGNMFGAESMFHRVSDASKVAMVALMQWVEREGITLVDVQVTTPHTARMGAVEVPRDEYLLLLRNAIQ